MAHLGFLQWLTWMPAAVGGKRGQVLGAIAPTKEDFTLDKEKPQSVGLGLNSGRLALA